MRLVFYVSVSMVFLCEGVCTASCVQCIYVLVCFHVLHVFLCFCVGAGLCFKCMCCAHMTLEILHFWIADLVAH